MEKKLFGRKVSTADFFSGVLRNLPIVSRLRVKAVQIAELETELKALIEEEGSAKKVAH